MNRHLSRMIAMQSLYEIRFREGADTEEVLDRNIDEYSDKCEPDFIKGIVLGIAKEEAKIDKIITDIASEWPLDQISLIDKVILQLSIYEMVIDKKNPPKVVMNEAVELSKQFGGDNSSKFVNGVLGSVYTKFEKEINNQSETL